jgi:DNA-binding NtrC family response regulator
MNPAGDGSGATARHIIVVDDEPMLLELAESILTPAGYRVSLYRDPTLVIETLEHSPAPPDLLVTDYAMLQMNGLQLMERCRQIHPGLRVLLVSGTVTECIFENSPCKPDRFLAKPYDFLTFLATVSELSEGAARQA